MNVDHLPPNVRTLFTGSLNPDVLTSKLATRLLPVLEDWTREVERDRNYNLHRNLSEHMLLRPEWFSDTFFLLICMYLQTAALATGPHRGQDDAKDEPAGTKTMEPPAGASASNATESS